jgi:hypothetical protein
MQRSLRVVSVKADRNGFFRARVAATATASEQLTLRDFGSRDAEIFGTVFGIPSAAAAKLQPQDVLTCEECTCTIEQQEYTKDGETKVGINVAFNVSGHISRSAAVSAICDW